VKKEKKSRRCHLAGPGLDLLHGPEYPLPQPYFFNWRYPLKFALLILFAFCSAPAMADSLSDQVEKIASDLVSREINKSGTALYAENHKLLVAYPSEREGEVRAITLKRLVSRTEVDATVEVHKQYVAFNAGGDAQGSFTVQVEVQLVTNPDDGRVLSTKAVVKNATLREFGDL
jgi:hypothetical protein